MANDDEKLYAGRWVARLRGRVIAQGGTPDQARQAAQSRFKETPEIIFMATSPPLIFPPILELCATGFTGRNFHLSGRWSGARCISCSPHT